MADIELVIKISDYDKEWITNGYYIPEEINMKISEAIANGTPLPKGHGKLGDLDKIKKEMQNYYDDCAKTSEYTRLGFETAIAVVEDALAIIEADTESEE